MKPMPLLWVDVETTGLDPEADHLLEVAAVETDEQLQVVKARTLVLHHAAPIEVVKVRDMHRASGLDVEAARSRWTTKDADSFLAESFPGRHVMAGSQVHFDRSWIRIHLPNFYERFQKECLDLQTLRFWLGHRGYSDGPKLHRALFDVLANVNEMRGLLRD